MTNPNDLLRHYVTGAIERGEAEAITEQRATDGITLYVHGKPVVLTAATIAKTFEWFAASERKCAAEATAGSFYVNDLERYVALCEANAAAYDRHETEGRYSLAFLQHAYYIQSGESVPLLS